MFGDRNPEDIERRYVNNRGNCALKSGELSLVRIVTQKLYDVDRIGVKVPIG